MTKIKGQREFFQFYVKKVGEIHCKNDHSSSEWIVITVSPTKTVDRTENYYKRKFHQEKDTDSSDASGEASSSDYYSTSESDSSDDSDEGPKERPNALEAKGDGIAKHSESSILSAAKKISERKSASGYNTRASVHCNKKARK